MVCAIEWVPKLLMKVSEGVIPSINVYRATNLEILFLSWRECSVQ